jgi:hypothetical protein
VVLIDGGKKSAANNEKLPLRFAKNPAAFERLFFSNLCQTPDSELKVHPSSAPVK